LNNFGVFLLCSGSILVGSCGSGDWPKLVDLVASLCVLGSGDRQDPKFDGQPLGRDQAKVYPKRVPDVSSNKPKAMLVLGAVGSIHREGRSGQRFGSSEWRKLQAS
jgi:hypothetical protein